MNPPQGGEDIDQLSRELGVGLRLTQPEAPWSRAAAREHPAQQQTRGQPSSPPGRRHGSRQATYSQPPDPVQQSSSPFGERQASRRASFSLLQQPLSPNPGRQQPSSPFSKRQASRRASFSQLQQPPSPNPGRQGSRRASFSHGPSPLQQPSSLAGRGQSSRRASFSQQSIPRQAADGGSGGLEPQASGSRLAQAGSFGGAAASALQQAPRQPAAAGPALKIYLHIQNGAPGCTRERVQAFFAPYCFLMGEVVCSRHHYSNRRQHSWVNINFLTERAARRAHGLVDERIVPELTNSEHTTVYSWIQTRGGSQLAPETALRNWARESGNYSSQEAVRNSGPALSPEGFAVCRALLEPPGHPGFALGPPPALPYRQMDQLRRENPTVADSVLLAAVVADLQPPFALQPSIWWMAAWAARRWAEGQLQQGVEPAATLVTKYALEADLRWEQLIAPRIMQLLATFAPTADPGWDQACAGFTYDLRQTYNNCVMALFEDFQWDRLVDRAAPIRDAIVRSCLRWFPLHPHVRHALQQEGFVLVAEPLPVYALAG